MFAMKSFAVAFALSLLATAADAAGIKTPADANGPAQTELVPASGQGRVVIVVSGKLGPDFYEDYADRVAALGYDTILLSGDDILSPDKQGGMRLRQATARALASPHALPGKIAVIGFSEGGGGALAYATRGEKSIAIVIVYYPETAFLLRPGGDLNTFVSGFKVPVLAFAGGKDTYKNCCLIATIQSINSDAQQLGLPFELVVYPNADHDFIKGPHYRAGDAADAWKRTTDALQQHLSQ
jgi:dienelactone hydrolase